MQERERERERKIGEKPFKLSFSLKVPLPFLQFQNHLIGKTKKN